jgi:membrane-bound inhibitor of C-type lysozyme
MRTSIAAFALIGMLCAAQAQELQPRNLRAYPVGNSLTFGAMSGLPASMGSRGAKYQAGWHVFWGGSLSASWAKEDTPSNATPKHGSFRKALTEHEWAVNP